MPEAISPEKFETFLRGTVLEDISIWSVSAERFAEELPDKVEIQYGEASELKACHHKRATIHATYGVRLKEPGSDESIAVLEVTLRAVYEVPETMDEATFEQFRQLTLRIHTVSFAREWFRDASARMGLRPVLLPLALAHPAAVRPPKKRASKKSND